MDSKVGLIKGARIIYIKNRVGTTIYCQVTITAIVLYVTQKFTMNLLLKCNNSLIEQKSN